MKKDVSTQNIFDSFCLSLLHRVRYFRENALNFDQSEARKQCFLASDWLKFETLPGEYRTLKVRRNS